MTAAAILRAAARDLADGWLDALFPLRCALCGELAEDGVACARHALPRAPCGPRCGRCDAALASFLPHGSTCADCRRRPPGFARLVALADYRLQAPAREWVLALKHGGRRDLAWPLGRALAARLRAAVPEELARAPAPLLVPVPSHRWRRLERGHDPAAALAEAAARASGLVCLRALRRLRATLPQGAPGAVSRRANVRGAFAAKRGAARRLPGRAVWLVDDVVTSGATAAECARALRRAGARRVAVLAVGRAAGIDRPVDPGGRGEAGL